MCNWHRGDKVNLPIPTSSILKVSAMCEQIIVPELGGYNHELVSDKVGIPYWFITFYDL